MLNMLDKKTTRRESEIALCEGLTDSELLVAPPLIEVLRRLNRLKKAADVLHVRNELLKDAMIQVLNGTNFGGEENQTDENGLVHMTSEGATQNVIGLWTAIITETLEQVAKLEVAADESKTKH